jgi:hypothetical protein
VFGGVGGIQICGADLLIQRKILKINYDLLFVKLNTVKWKINYK